MTLILTCLTEQFVVQASDQRLAHPTTGVVSDDRANKAIVFDNAMALAYTGISEIPGTLAHGGVRTDDWIFDVLSDHMDSLPEALRAVTDGLTALVGDRYPLGVIGGGWATDRGEPVPIYFRTANFINALGELCALHAPFTERCEWHRYPWRANDFLLREAGQSLSAEERGELRSAIRGGLRHGLGPSHFERQLVEAIRAAALRLEQSSRRGPVGYSIVASCLPRAAFVSRDPTPPSGRAGS